MDFTQVYAVVGDAITTATPAARRGFGESTAERLLTDPEINDIVTEEITSEARTAFASLKSGFLTASPDDIHAWVSQVYDGWINEGTMDPFYIIALDGLSGWADYLAGDLAGLRTLAEKSIDLADYYGSPPMGDFLAAPQVAEELDRILAILRNEAMINVAYTPEYRESRRELDEHGASILSGGVERIGLGDGLTAESHQRPGETAVTTLIFDSSGAEVYRWTTVDDNCDFVTLIHHSNGRKYLVFRVDLYGYGVLDLESGRDFFYVPKGETFIWTSVHYNPGTDVAAVEGCVWACPWSVIIVDFRDPMRESLWADVWNLVEGRHGYINFSKWDGTTLVLSVKGADKPIVGKCEIPSTEYLALLKPDNGRTNTP